MVKKLGLKLKEQKGFTLIELLAVIVILGIIAAIAIPAIGNVINKSETKATAQEGVQIINAAKMYVANESPATVGITDTNLTVTLDKADLEDYLDHVKSKGEFTVIVTKDASSGKFSYELSGVHEAIPSGETKISEQDLVDDAQ